MTRPLYYSGVGQLREMTDGDQALLRHNLQQAYANHLRNGGAGRFALGGSNSGVAINTERTRRTGSGNNSPGVQGSDYPGTGTTNRAQYGFNQTTPSLAISDSEAMLAWNGSAIQRMGDSLLDDDLFLDVRAQILTGNELGSYRIQSSSPGTGWHNFGQVWRDSIYNNSQQSTKNLYLKNGGVTAPTNTPRDTLYWNGSAIQLNDQIGVNSTLIQNYLLPRFVNWSFTNGLRWRVNTSNVGTNRGTLVDRRRTSTSNTRGGGDTYISTPTGGAFTFRTYYFHAS